MAYEESRFFDDVNGDKEYSADDFAEYFRTFFTNGVIDVGTNLQVTAPGGTMSVGVGYGAAMIQGYGYWLKEDAEGAKTLAIPAANTLPRYDAVILRMDKSTGIRGISLLVLSGAPAAVPVVPVLTRSGNVYELALASILVPANATAIAPANVTDLRENLEACGLVVPKKFLEFLNQAVKNTSSPTFAGLTITGTLQADKVIGATYQ